MIILFRRIFLSILLLDACGVTPCRAVAPQQEVLDFMLLDQRGRAHELKRIGGTAVVLFFTANDCPVARLSASKLLALQERFEKKGVRFLLVNANTADDRRSILSESYRLRIQDLPILKDEAQALARHLDVHRTGETVAISAKNWSVFYRGAIDDQLVEGAQKPEPTAHYLENALNAFLAGQPIPEPTTSARGCVIQYDGANGPDKTPVSYATDIAPILIAKCVGCHSPGNIGSGAMTSYKKVKGKAAMIEEVLLAQRMPPWGADPHYGRFRNDPSLSVAETQTLLRWIHQGALRGDGPDPLASLQTQPAKPWPLGEPDIVLRLPNRQEIPASGVLPYRHIEVDVNNDAEGWVGAAYVKPGNSEVVHHVILRLKENGEKDQLGDIEMFAGWAPGSTQGWCPPHSGRFLPKNARFDFELHYTPNGSPQTDQTEVGLYLLKEKPLARFQSVPVVNNTFEITPGDPNSQAFANYGFKKPATLHSVTPHMHVRGKWMKFDILHPNGTKETVCSVPRYDFNWQLTYVLAQPQKIPAGTWVQLSGGYDNSAMNPGNPDPSRTVHWGDQSFDEMFLGWYNVTWDLSEPGQLSQNSR